MSIHAKLSPEAEARLAAQRRNSSITSAVIALLVVVIIGLVLGFFLLPNLAKETPVIVTYQGTVVEETEQVKEKVKTSIQRKPSSPSSSMACRSNSPKRPRTRSARPISNWSKPNPACLPSPGNNPSSMAGA